MATQPVDPIDADAAVRDARGRALRDLRISVTDRCNFRCTYCMPKDVFGADFPFLPRGEILAFEEIARLARIFARLGARKLRLTGGEPLLRNELPSLVRMLRDIQGVDIALTTNGSLLAQHAAALAAAGLRRVTVSLDSLDEAVFRKMNDVDFPLARVLDGIAAATDAGLPVKLNAVVRRGLNEHTVVGLARWAREQGHIVRFIEYMDVGHSNGWRLDDVVPGEEIVRRIAAEMPVEPVPANYPGEVAQRWRYADGGGEIGVITSVTRPFCGDCTRARLSADGKLYTCLFATRGSDLRALLRSDADDATIEHALHDVWSVRDDRYSELRSEATVPLDKVEMSYIGG